MGKKERELEQPSFSFAPLQEPRWTFSLEGVSFLMPWEVIKNLTWSRKLGEVRFLREKRDLMMESEVFYN